MSLNQRLLVRLKKEFPGHRIRLRGRFVSECCKRPATFVIDGHVLRPILHKNIPGNIVSIAHLAPKMVEELFFGMIVKEVKKELESIMAKAKIGVKFDGKKVRVDLLSPIAMLGTARVLTHGSMKYGDDNWRGGLDYKRVYGALLRHLFAWFLGEENDRYSGLRHIDHAACCMMFLQELTLTRKDCDDRFKWSKKRVSKMVEDMLAEVVPAGLTAGK